MRCIFCKNDSDRSVSEEHIIPQSLGNSRIKLARGIVCDACNRYFSVKVEKPVLDSLYFRHVRHRNAIPSKKGRIPTLEVLYGPNGEELGMYRTVAGAAGIYPLDDRSSQSFINHVLTHESSSVWFAEPPKPDMRQVSRLLAKIALEVLAARVCPLPQWNEDMVTKRELDEIRDYARFDRGPLWPFYERRLYAEDKAWDEPGKLPIQVLHEFTLLYTTWHELFAVICILGVEYAFNLGGPEIGGYARWIAEKDGESPLYPGVPIPF